MSRFSHLGIGVALSVFLLFWFFFGVVIYIGYAGFNFGIDIYVVLWIAIFFGSIWGVFWSFRRGLCPPGKELNRSRPQAGPVLTSESNQESKPQDFNADQVDEKLAALLQKPKPQNPEKQS